MIEVLNTSSLAEEDKVKTQLFHLLTHKTPIE